MNSSCRSCLIILHSYYPPHGYRLVKMAAFATTRVNLLPTSRILANGVPAAVGLKTALPLQFDHGHGHGGPRSDRVPSFVGKDNGIISQTRLNGMSGLPLGAGVWACQGAGSDMIMAGMLNWRLGGKRRPAM